MIYLIKNEQLKYYQQLLFVFKFKDNDSFWLKNIDFQVNQNELVAIIGPVGAGKVNIFSYYKHS